VSVAEGLHCINVPALVSPNAPNGEQNAPGCTPRLVDAVVGSSMIVVVFGGAGGAGAGGAVVAGGGLSEVPADGEGVVLAIPGDCGAGPSPFRGDDVPHPSATTSVTAPATNSFRFTTVGNGREPGDGTAERPQSPDDR
jgi:hypothetical protein